MNLTARPNSRRKRPSPIRFASGQRLELEDLDRLLEVPDAQFESRVAKLCKLMHARGARVDVDAYRAKSMPSAPVAVRRAEASAFRGSKLYQAQLDVLPRMDRSEEYRMARRYEFLRERARRGVLLAGRRDPSQRLQAAGEPSALDLLKGSRDTLWAAMPARIPHRRRGHLERCLEELDALRNLYVEGALYMVFSGVYRYAGLGVDTADLVQEGNASLFQAIDGFDWRRDVRFKTYAQYWVHQAVLKVLYNASRTVRIPIWAQKLLKKIHRLQADADSDGRLITTTEIGRRLDLTPQKVEELLAIRRYSRSLDAELEAGEGASLAQMLPDEESIPVPEQVVEGDLGETLGGLIGQLSEREQMILRRRFGLDGGEPETLGDIAVDLGVTAERVRQLQKAALEKLQDPAAMAQLKAFA